MDHNTARKLSQVTATGGGVGLMDRLPPAAEEDVHWRSPSTSTHGPGEGIQFGRLVTGDGNYTLIRREGDTKNVLVFSDSIREDIKLAFSEDLI